jgi:hypothetical protein
MQISIATYIGKLQKAVTTITKNLTTESSVDLITESGEEIVTE